MYTPEGFNTVAPYFVVEDADVLIDFLVAGFRGVETGRTDRDGRIANAQVKIGDSTVMIGESNEHTKSTEGHYCLYVENAKDAMKTAIDAGGELVMEVSEMSYGDLQGGVKDPCGNVWWVSQRIVDEPYH